jgi:small conductance mechanosensitive channel
MLSTRANCTVKEIGLLATTIMKPANVSAFVGKNRIFSDTVWQFPASPHRRVERPAQLAHVFDPHDAISRLKTALAKIPNITRDPAPAVGIIDFNEARPGLAVHPQTHTDHYWQVYFDTNKAITDTFGAAGNPVPEAYYRVQQKPG